MDDVFDYTEAMGNAVSARWEMGMGGLKVFPEVALSVLRDFEPQRKLTIPKVCSDVVSVGNRLPKQQRAGGARFGQPPLTLYNDPGSRFFIEMYLWSSMDMTIHDHPFTGAFTVLRGQCRNDVFRFDPEGGTEDFQIGNLQQVDSEFLSPGIGREITNGRTFIHRNLHLSKPTVTFIIRTPWDDGTGLLYEEGGLAVNPALSACEFKQLEFLEGLLRLDEAETSMGHLEQVISGSKTPYLAYKALNLYARKTGRYSDIEQFLPLFRSLLGDLGIKHLREVFRCQAQASSIQPVGNGS
jgi:hypothetical protein